MNQRILMVLAATLCCMTIWAQPISEQQAKERALQYLHRDNSSAKSRRLAPAESRLKAAPTGATSIYAFNVEGGGYIIASADGRTLPVLGYSTTGSIDWDEMPENMRNWLKQYDKAVATLGDCSDYVDGCLAGTHRTNAHPDRKAVEPIIKTHWGQEEPFWDQCPIYQGADKSMVGQRCVTGCFATALAQILNYYQWPKSLPDGLPDYTINSESDGNKKTWHINALPPVTFDWDNMLNDYVVENPETGEYAVVGTDAQKQAVATLMRYCGQSVLIDYNPSGSGAEAYNYYSLIDYWGYSGTMHLTREEYTIEEWDSIIYGEMAAGRPVLYAGSYEGGTHAFICDGYDGEGMFHINWGWDGSADGFFALAVLNPLISNTPGGGSSYGFCYMEDAIIHLDPKMEKEAVPKGSFWGIRQTSGLMVKKETFVTVTCKYYADNDIVADYALGTIDGDGTLTPVFMGDLNGKIIRPNHLGHFWTNSLVVEIDPTAFQSDEALRLYPMIRERQADAQWQPVPPLRSHIVAGRTAEGEFFCYSTPLYQLSVESEGTITYGSGLIGERTEVSFDIKNSSDEDMKGEIQILPVYFGYFADEDITESTPYFFDDWIKSGASIKAGETASVSFSFRPKQSGVTAFFLKSGEQDFGFESIILPFDTIVNYDAYVYNNSYFTREGDQWYYNIELCDKPGVRVPFWVPSDSIGFKIDWYIDSVQINEISIRDEIKEYLKHLPENAGNGEYKFNYQMPIDISQPGAYRLQSHVGTWTDGGMSNLSCPHLYEFKIEIPSGITPTTTTTESGIYYDLTGRPIDKTKLSRGIYIVGGKKVFVR